MKTNSFSTLLSGITSPFIPSDPRHSFTGLLVRLLLGFICVLIISLSNKSYGQAQDTTTYRVETRDGNEFLGKIVFDSPESITLITKNLGEIRILKSDIVRIEAIRPTQMVGGELWFDNPQASRYFWMPNGYGIKKGEGYYQNVWIVVNQFVAAPADNFSVGAGIVPAFLLGGPSPAWVTGKFSIPVQPNNVNLGVGILSGTVLGEEGTGFGIAYGMSTFGTRDKNISFGMGYGYAGGNWSERPTISVGAMVRTSNRGYFITENYYIGTGEEPLLLFSFGGRRIVKKVSIDFGLIIPAASGMTMLVAIPWLGLTVPFVPKVK